MISPKSAINKYRVAAEPSALLSFRLARGESALVVGGRVGVPTAKVGGSVWNVLSWRSGDWVSVCVDIVEVVWLVCVDIVEVVWLVCVDIVEVNRTDLPFPLDPPFALDALIPRRSIECPGADSHVGAIGNEQFKEGWGIG